MFVLLFDVYRSSTAGIDPQDTVSDYLQLTSYIPKWVMYTYIQAWPDKVIKKEVANLQMVCENKTTGCQ